MIPALKKTESVSSPNTTNSSTPSPSLASFASLTSELTAPSHLKNLQQKDFPLSPYSFGYKWLNFGVVKKNSHYILYRSSFLGKYGLKGLKKHLNASKLPFPKTIIYMGHFGYQKKFPLIGQFALEELFESKNFGHAFFHSFDPLFPTYLDGRNPYCPRKLNLSKHLDPEVMNLLGHAHGDLPPAAPYGNSDDLIRIIKHILNPQNSPVLFHCFAGMHRTGMIAQILRYLEGGTWLEKTQFHQLFSTSLDPIEFEYYLHCRMFYRKENIKFVQKFVYEDPRFQILKATYQKTLQAL